MIYSMIIFDQSHRRRSNTLPRLTLLTRHQTFLFFLIMIRWYRLARAHIYVHALQLMVHASSSLLFVVTMEENAQWENELCQWSGKDTIMKTRRRNIILRQSERERQNTKRKGGHNSDHVRFNLLRPILNTMINIWISYLFFSCLVQRRKKITSNKPHR